MNEAVFRTATGVVTGWHDDDVTRATGIPYAQSQRFSAPTSLPDSTAAINATEFAPACPQLPVPELDALLGIESSSLPHDEDCLKLSVTVPRNQSSEPRPVMVWIHGGSYVVGAGDSPIFDTRPLCLEQDVVVVSVTYRLGLFGFLGGYRDRPANLGLLDIIEALKWVRKNIEAFGGNPENITLFGESAGGDAIAHLMISQGTEGLFHRAIIQSAPLGIRQDRKEMSAAMGKVASAMDETHNLEDMLATQQKAILTGNKFGLKGGMPFSPQYGFYPLPDEVDAEAEWERRAKEIDVLIGYNKEETALFIYAMPTILKISKLPLIGRIFKNAIVKRTTAKVYSDATTEFAKRHSNAGGRAYHYHLTWGEARDFLGACHTIDLPLLFGDWGTWKNARLLEGLPKNELVQNGKKVRHMWASFAREGRLQGTSGTIPDVLTWKEA